LNAQAGRVKTSQRGTCPRKFRLDPEGVKRRLAISEPLQFGRVELVIAVGVDRRHNLPAVALLIKVHHVVDKVADGRTGHGSQERAAVVMEARKELHGPQGMVGRDSYLS